MQLIEQAESNTGLEEAMGEKISEDEDAFVRQSRISHVDVDHTRDVVHRFRKIATYFTDRRMAHIG